MVICGGILCAAFCTVRAKSQKSEGESERERDGELENLFLAPHLKDLDHAAVTVCTQI